jgi:hypothetical protein
MRADFEGRLAAMQEEIDRLKRLLKRKTEKRVCFLPPCMQTCRCYIGWPALHAQN